MLFSIVFNYISGIEIHRYREENNQRFLRFSFWFTVAVNLAILGFFKYYGFLITNLNVILPMDIPYKELALPQVCLQRRSKQTCCRRYMVEMVKVRSL